MTKTITTYFLTAFLCLIVFSSFGQTDTANKGRSFSFDHYHIENIQFIIKTDILLPIISAINKRTTSTFTGEFCFNQRHSIQVTGLHSAYSITGRKDFSLQIISEYKFCNYSPPLILKSFLNEQCFVNENLTSCFSAQTKPVSLLKNISHRNSHHTQSRIRRTQANDT